MNEFKVFDTETGEDVSSWRVWHLHSDGRLSSVSPEGTSVFADDRYQVRRSTGIDAERYRFLRDEDNWGEDSGEDSWEALGESHGVLFDEIVDSRISKNEAKS